MKLALVKGETNVTVYVFVQDSSVTTGAGLTGLVFNSASLVASQVRPLAVRVVVTLVTQTVTGAYTSGGFVEIDSTNMPGVYRLDLPDAVCASGVDSVVVMLKGASNMAPVLLEIQLTTFDLNTDSVGLVDALGATAKADVNAECDTAISDYDGPTNAEMVARTLVSASYFDPAADTVVNVTTVATLSGHTAQTGDNFIRIGAPAGASISADIAAIKAETALIVADTNELQTDDVPGLIAALNDPTSAVIADAVWDEVLTGATHNVVNSAGRRLRTLQESGAVYGGQVWIDTLNGTAGTTSFENGTSDNHVLTIGDAKTIATSVGLVDFHIINGSTITFAVETGHESYFGDNWSLALGGQNIHGSHIEGATITGIGTASDDEVSFDGCEFGIATVELGHFDFCGFFGTLILGKTGDYNFHNCYSKGNIAPTFSKTAGQAIVMETINFVGGITISGVQSGDTYELQGRFHTITLNGVDGTVHVNGGYEAIVDNRTGSPTLVITGAVKISDIAEILTDTSDMQPKLGSPAADISADIAAVKSETALIVADTNELQTDDVPGLIAALNDLSAAAVNAEVDTALVDINLDHLMKIAAVTGDVVNNSIIARLTSKSATPAFSDYVNTTDSLQAQRDNVGSAVGADISADIADIPTVSEFDARTILAANYFDPAADTVANVTTVATVTTLTGHTVQTGDNFVRLGVNGAGLTDLGGMSTGMKAEVNAEMVDVESVDTVALPGKIAPPLVPTRDQMLAFLYKGFRNRNSLDKTALLHRIFADDESTVDHQAAISDDGTTFIREEMVVGA